jgi:hypothetical protein
VFGAENMSFPQRVLIGHQLTYKDGQPVNPIKEGVDRVSIITNENAKITQWDPADIASILSSVESDVQELTSISATAPTVTIAQLANIGSDALRALKEAHVAKVAGYHDDFGDPAERSIRLAARMAGDMAVAEDQSLEVGWMNLNDPSLSELGDFFSKAASLPLQAQLEMTGKFSPQQIDEYLGMQAQKQQQDALMAEMAAVTAPQTPSQPPEAVAPGQ